MLRKVLNDQSNDILTAFIDLSEIMGRQKGNLTEEKVLKAAGYSFFGKADLFLDKVDGDYNTMLGISPSIIHTELKKLGYEMKDFELK